MSFAYSTPHTSSHTALDTQKNNALDMLDEAWVEAARSGVSVEIISHAALFKSVATFVSSYGEDAVAEFMRTISHRVMAGEFTVGKVLH